MTLGSLLFGNRLPPGASDPDWENLLRAIAGGSAQALYALWDRTHRIVHTLLLRTTRERDTADDLTLAVFDDVWRLAKTHEFGGASVIAWMLNEARSKAVRLPADRPARRPIEPSSGWPMDELPVPRASLRYRLADRIDGGRPV